jgi:predicted dehydrogenase
MRALVCGGGLMGRWHAHAVRAAGGSVVAVVDPADSSLAEALGVPGERDLSSALGEHRPDIVHVCSPAAAHEAHARLALGRSLHVLVEKPVCLSAPAVDALLDLAESVGATVTPGHQFPFQPWRADVPRIGSIVSLEHAVCSAGGEGADGPSRAELAWGITWHTLSLAEQLLAPGTLRSLRWAAAAPADGELRGFAAAPDGRTVSVSVSLTGRPPRNELTVVGSRGTLRADLSHGFGVLDASGTARLDKVLRPFRRAGGELTSATGNLGRRALEREPAFPGLQALVAAAHAHAQGLRAPPLPHQHTRDVACAADALRAALVPE